MTVVHLLSCTTQTQTQTHAHAGSRPRVSSVSKAGGCGDFIRFLVACSYILRRSSITSGAVPGPEPSVIITASGGGTGHEPPCTGVNSNCIYDFDRAANIITCTRHAARRTPQFTKTPSCQHGGVWRVGDWVSVPMRARAIRTWQTETARRRHKNPSKTSQSTTAAPDPRHRSSERRRPRGTKAPCSAFSTSPACSRARLGQGGPRCSSARSRSPVDRHHQRQQQKRSLQVDASTRHGA